MRTTASQELVELLPCPFCAATDPFSERADYSSSYVVCNNCLARGPVCCQDSDEEDEPGKDGAIAAWNTRALPTAQAADQWRDMVEALTKCRDKFGEYVELHKAKLLPERHSDEFHQNARSGHNADVHEKIARNQAMVDLCDAALPPPPVGEPK